MAIPGVDPATGHERPQDDRRSRGSQALALALVFLMIFAFSLATATYMFFRSNEQLQADLASARHELGELPVDHTPTLGPGEPPVDAPSSIFLRSLDCPVPLAWQFRMHLPHPRFRLRAIVRPAAVGQPPLSESAAPLYAPAGTFLLTIYLQSGHQGVDYRFNIVHERKGVAGGGELSPELSIDDLRSSHDPHRDVMARRLRDSVHGDLLELDPAAPVLLFKLEDGAHESPEVLEMWLEACSNEEWLRLTGERP